MEYRRLFTYAFLGLAAFATVPSAQPESDIAIPAEKSEITQNVPDLGPKEKDDWQRLREERKLARQQILTDIKASVQAEIKDLRKDMIQQKPKNNGNKRWNEASPFDVPKPNKHFPFPKNQ